MRYLSAECIGTLPFKISSEEDWLLLLPKDQIPQYYQRVFMSLAAKPKWYEFSELQ